MEPTTGIEPVNLILTKDALYQLSYVGLERETGFEPATHSLEGCCSSQLSYSRPLKRCQRSVSVQGVSAKFPNCYPMKILFWHLHSHQKRYFWWRGEDSNLRRL